MRKRQGCLVRVGIDATSGGWNAPVNQLGEFVYVPIPETGTFRPGLEKKYDEFINQCNKFDVKVRFPSEILVPEKGKPSKLVLQEQAHAHLDPDFSYLTYGDIYEPTGKTANRRGEPLMGLERGDILVFYAGLNPCRELPRREPLVYAIIGFYVLKHELQLAKDFLSNGRDHDESAHTRLVEMSDFYIIASGQPDKSGRLTKCIEIGDDPQKHKGKYWLKEGLSELWGGFHFKDLKKRTSLYIQRSGALPRFCDAEKFCTWFEKQNIKLIPENNPK